MGHLEPNPITGIPYLPPEHRGEDGYMNRLGLDEESRDTIKEARKLSGYLMDDETGLYSLGDIKLPMLFSTSDQEISGSGSTSIYIDDIDGPTLIENTRELAFSFSLKKINMKLGTTYGSYDEYDVEFLDFSLSQTIGLSDAALSRLEMKIKESIIGKVKTGHVHKNGE